MKTPSPPAHAERILNGDFSEGGTHWQVYGDVNFDDERCNIGRNGVVVQPVAGIPAGRYRLACRAAVVLPGGFPGAQMRVSIDDENVIRDISSTTPGDYELLFDLPAGVSRVEVYLEGNTAAAWFDDVSLDLAPQGDELLLNGDFAEGNAHWDMTGAVFDGQSCALRMDDVSQTVAVPVIGYYRLTARARAGEGSMGRLQIRLLPTGANHYVPINANGWSDYEIEVAAIQGESEFKVSLIRISGNDVEFDDVSLKILASIQG